MFRDSGFETRVENVFLTENGQDFVLTERGTPNEVLRAVEFHREASRLRHSGEMTLLCRED